RGIRAGPRLELVELGRRRGPRRRVLGPRWRVLGPRRRILGRVWARLVWIPGLRRRPARLLRRGSVLVRLPALSPRLRVHLCSAGDRAAGGAPGLRAALGGGAAVLVLLPGSRGLLPLGRAVSGRVDPGRAQLRSGGSVMRESRAVRLRSLLVGCALALPACATTPLGPSDMALPGYGKSFAEFQDDDQGCRQWAGERTGTTTTQAGDTSGIKSAAVGTAVGAASGAAIGAATGNAGAGAAIGAGSGLLVGSAAGASAGAFASQE